MVKIKRKHPGEADWREKTSWGREHFKKLRMRQICLGRRKESFQAENSARTRKQGKIKPNVFRRQQATLADGEGKEVRDTIGKAGRGQIQEFRFYSVNNKNQAILNKSCDGLKKVLVVDYTKIWIGDRTD